MLIQYISEHFEPIIIGSIACIIIVMMRSSRTSQKRDDSSKPFDIQHFVDVITTRLQQNSTLDTEISEERFKKSFVELLNKYDRPIQLFSEDNSAKAGSKKLVLQCSQVRTTSNETYYCIEGFLNRNLPIAANFKFKASLDNIGIEHFSYRMLETAASSPTDHLILQTFTIQLSQVIGYTYLSGELVFARNVFRLKLRNYPEELMQNSKLRNSLSKLQQSTMSYEKFAADILDVLVLM